MPRFFIDSSSICTDKITITGEDARHISLSLRAKPGESFIACDGDGTDYCCKIESITKSEVVLAIDEKKQSITEPNVSVTLYQALVKSDKFDFIVQKCTELGVDRIVPVLSERCISKPDEASARKKAERWNKIAKEAAMQSGRGKIPLVESIVSFDEALDCMKKADMPFICYEAQPHVPIDEIYSLCKKRGEVKTVAFFVGPEGGISEKEAKSAVASGLALASLGPRILRAETAPLCVMSSLMLITGNMN